MLNQTYEDEDYPLTIADLTLKRRSLLTRLIDKLWRYSSYSKHTLGGQGIYLKRRVCGIWFFKRVSQQKWSALNTHVRTDYGICFGHYSIAWSRAYSYYNDGKQPSRVAKDW